MKTWSSRLLLVAVVAGVAGCATWARWTHTAEPAAAPTPPAEAPGAHVMLAPKALKWRPFPPGGAGAKLAVLSGDPDKPGPFVIRIRQPAGSRIPPHWHPTDEHVTVVKGTMYFAMGERFRTHGAREMPAGSYLLLPAKMAHFAWTAKKGESIVQVHGMGPFQVIFVNPADDPRTKTGKR
jgi:quercetin dioxygenase-like cupin family protein